MCEWDAEPRRPANSGTQVDVDIGRDAVASQFASKGAMHSEETEKLVIASFTGLSEKLSHSTQGMAEDNRDRRTSNGKNKSAGVL